MNNNQYIERYFLNHGVGIFPQQEARIAEAMAGYAADWCTADNWDKGLAKRHEFLSSWAHELGTIPGNLCTMENVTTAVATLFGALPEVALKGRTVLIARDCFPSLHFLLNGLQERYGFTLKTVEDESSPYMRDEVFLDAWDDEVGLALLTWVSSTTSHRIDLDKMVAQANKMGSLTVADITQGAAIIPLDVEKCDLDFVVTTSLKWACGSPGAGLIYVKPNHLDECAPELRGWFSQDDPFRWDLEKFQYADDAGRFQNGTPAILAAYASAPGFEWREEVGTDNILTSNRKLTEQIRDHANNNGWNILTPAPVEERGGSTMIQMPENTDVDALFAMLTQKGFTADYRGSTLRLSPGFTTTADAVGELCALLSEYVASDSSF